MTSIRFSLLVDFDIRRVGVLLSPFFSPVVFVRILGIWLSSVFAFIDFGIDLVIVLGVGRFSVDWHEDGFTLR